MSHAPSLLMDYLFERCSPEPNSGCWLWTRACKSNGYGHFRHPNTSQILTAHRASYQAFVGPIPDGLQVCHKCDVRSCINPNHLFLGSHQTNMDDARLKHRFASGSRHGLVQNPHCVKRGTSHWRCVLSDKDIKTIRETPATCKVLGVQYGVSKQTISEIRTRKTWQHVT